jgi:hypothetical protein
MVPAGAALLATVKDRVSAFERATSLSWQVRGPAGGRA